MRKPMITAVLNAHREGMLARPSLESLSRSVAHAERAGLETETIIVLDRPDSLTSTLVSQFAPKGHRALVVDHGDLGESRNSAVQAARGRYVSFLDADDLWGVDWLTRAVQVAETRTDPVIWHPEVCLYFGGTRHILHHVDMEDAGFRPTALMLQNYWTALSFSRRDIYLDTPYPATDLKEGFGFEDWGWNMATIGKGVIHKIVPGTGHVIRKRHDASLSKQTVSARAVPRPSAYLRRFVGSGKNDGSAQAACAADASSATSEMARRIRQ